MHRALSIFVTAVVGTIVHAGCSIPVGQSSTMLASYRPQPRPWTLTGPFANADDTADKEENSSDDNGRWHLDLGMRIGHTKLASTEQKLDRRLDVPLKLDIFGVFHHPQTPIDSKSNLALNTFYFGIGQQEADWLSWTWYVGGGTGRDEEHQRWLHLNLSTKFDYKIVYTGAVSELYPWGQPEHLDGLDWARRLRASRPYLLTGFEVGYVSASGEGYFAAAPFKLYKDSQKIRDWLFSYLLGLGWGMPINRNWTAHVSLHYSLHFYRPEEYNSWNFVTMFRRRF